ncbi:MAG TPA: thioredoxin [Holophagaceae bacterium]|nr:thioredoxin [Holophagaceae bacterium]
MTNVIHLSTAAFPKVKALEQPVLIDFWAPWCGPCRMQSPILEEVAAQVGDRAVIAKVNVDEEPELAAAFGVQSIPTLVVLKGERMVQRMVGLQQTPTLVKALASVEA